MYMNIVSVQGKIYWVQYIKCLSTYSIVRLSHWSKSSICCLCMDLPSVFQKCNPFISCLIKHSIYMYMQIIHVNYNACKCFPIYIPCNEWSDNFPLYFVSIPVGRRWVLHRKQYIPFDIHLYVVCAIHFLRSFRVQCKLF